MPPLRVPLFALQWQGVTQIFDHDWYRRCVGPFPEKDADVYRVAVFGDSLTYGAGIENEWTYSSQLQRLMGRDYRIEFINLGVAGAQSEDVLRRMRKMVPILKPEPGHLRNLSERFPAVRSRAVSARVESSRCLSR